jgi:hypothetical protein
VIHLNVHCKNNHYVYVFFPGSPAVDRKTNGEKQQNCKDHSGHISINGSYNVHVYYRSSDGLMVIASA